MATLYSDIAALQVDPTPKNMVSSMQVTPRTKILNPTYTTDGTETTSDTVYLVKVPKGTKVYSTRSKMRTSAAVAATAFAVNVGYYEDASTLDADKFGTAININGGANEFDYDEKVTYTFTSEGWITMTPSTVTGAVTAAVTIEHEIVVSYPN